ELDTDEVPAGDAGTGRPPFTTAEADTLRQENAVEYMRSEILAELHLEEPYVAGAENHHQYKGKESMGWNVDPRREYINRKACDTALSIHENTNPSVPARGMGMIVGDPPLPIQVRAAKLFMKYVDPFDQGLHQGGVVKKSGVGQVGPQNMMRGQHVYFELEFQTSTILYNPEVCPAEPTHYQYEKMVERAFVETVAKQIAAGVVEFLLDQQSDIDDVV